MKPKKKKIKESAVDKVFSLWIRNKDKTCQRCGTNQNLQCAHIFSRTARSVRWEPLNALTLCYKCHLFWAHKNPIEFTEFIRLRLGEKDFALLKKKYYALKSWSQKEKAELLKKYEP